MPPLMDIDDKGRLTVVQGQSDVVTGSLAAIGDTLELPMADYSSFMLTLGQGSTYTGATVVVESSIDGATWQSLLVVRADTAASPAATAISNASTAVASFLGSAPAALKVRARLTALTTGPVAVQFAGSASASNPVTQTHAVTGSVSIQPVAPTTNNYETAATTNATSVATTASTVTELSVFNPTGATVFLKLYNKASAPTVGTDTPIATIPVASGEFRSVPMGINGKRFSTGLAFALTGAAVKTDTTAIAAGVQLSLSRV